MGVAVEGVTGVVVTRGDVPIDEIVESLPFPVAVWDNSICEDLSVYGRYRAIKDAPTDVVFVQDDDVLLPPESIQALLDAYEPGVIVANMPSRFRPHYPDSCLVGFGAIFDGDLPADVFGLFNGEIPLRDVFNRTCDVIFTALMPRKLLDLPYQEMPWAHAANRMWKQPSHFGERQKVLELARRVRAH